MSEKLLKELEKHQETFERRRKRYMADGKITKREQQRLDRVQTKIDRILDALISQGNVTVIEGRAPIGPSENPPPGLPTNGYSEVQYDGLPLDKLESPYARNVSRIRAERVRGGLVAVDSAAQEVDGSANYHNSRTEALTEAQSKQEEVRSAFLEDAAEGKIDKLRQKVGGPYLSDKLEKYGKSSSELKQSMTNLEGKAKRLAAAQATLTQAEALLKSYETEKKRDADAKELAEIEGKLAKINEGIALYKDAAQDPLGTAKKLGIQVAHDLLDKFLVEVLTGGAYERRMNELKERIEKFNQQLDDLRLEGLKAGFEAATRTIEALEKESESFREAIEQAKTEQRDAIDALARMEKDNPGTTSVFGELQGYYENVEQAGLMLLESSKEFEGSILEAENTLPYNNGWKNNGCW